ncbi:hypothetical protein C8J57DRAFT_1285560 [Mycena rebaudengoi]|nr:hypothetical protein C8J57DRAFT_1285560 [Mycena rebaudengoi]
MNPIPSSSSLNGTAHKMNGSSPHPASDEITASFNGSENTPHADYSNGFLLDQHDTEIVNHLYQAGFQTGNYADTVLHVHQNIYRLHALILSRSPFLAHLMSTSPQGSGQRVVYVPLEREPEGDSRGIIVQGFAIALGYLYSSASMRSIHEKNCRAVLASAHLLGGMEELCTYSYDACRRSISVDTISEWLEFIETIPAPLDDTSSQDLAHTSVFGPYGQRLRDDVFHFLVVTLPQTLDIQWTQADSASSKSGRDLLLQIFSRVPFDLFKTAIESTAFEIGSDQTRFKFAKDAIDLRKRGIARGAEETVVLSNFGGSAVHIARRMRKKPLWKVNS